MRLATIVVAAFVAMGPPATAITLGRAAPHQQPYAICQTRSLVDYVNGEWAARDSDRDFENDFNENAYIYSDALGVRVGRVSSAQHPTNKHTADISEWVESLRSEDGKPDEGPLVATRLVLLQAH